MNHLRKNSELRPLFQTSIYLAFLMSTFSLFPLNLAHGKQFRNSYLSFELPTGWDCTPDQTSWACRSTDGPIRRRALIVFTAKEMGPTDTLANYQSHLGNPQMLYKGSSPYQGSNKPIYTKYNRINNLDWLDVLHVGTEIPGYYTRYLATLKPSLAILVTFTAHRDNYSLFNTIFSQAILSLRIIASPNILSQPNGFGPGQGGGEIFGNLSKQLTAEGVAMQSSSAPKGIRFKYKLGLLIGILLLISGYLVFKLKSPKNRP